MINVIRGIGCSNDASFEVVEKFENFKDASVRTLYTFVKEYAIEVAKERQENTMGHEFPLVEMVEDSNGLISNHVKDWSHTFAINRTNLIDVIIRSAHRLVHYCYCCHFTLHYRTKRLPSES